MVGASLRPGKGGVTQRLCQMLLMKFQAISRLECRWGILRNLPIGNVPGATTNAPSVTVERWPLFIDALSTR
jgi:hypothetical protein